MLAGSSMTNAGIHGDGYAEAGLPGTWAAHCAARPSFRIMELLFQHT
jgi:hypothetical protein